MVNPGHKTKSNIIIFGKNGQIGSNLLKILGQENQFEIQAFSSKEIDFRDLTALRNFLQNLIKKPDFIINAAAYTNVDKAEEEKELADLINHQAVTVIANYCKKNNVCFIHYSTNYIFDGSGDLPFTEDNSQNLKPLNYYGVTKLNAEKAIILSLCNYIILRISWIWDENPNSKNFVKTIERLAREYEEITVVNDQIGSPTSAKFVAEKTYKLIKTLLETKNTSPKDIYHLFESSYISWYEFAVNIVNKLRQKEPHLKVKNIKPIKTSEYKAAAQRPLNSRLGTIMRM